MDELTEVVNHITRYGPIFISVATLFVVGILAVFGLNVVVSRAVYPRLDTRGRRLAAVGFGMLYVLVLAYAGLRLLVRLGYDTSIIAPLTLAELIQTLEAGINDVVLVAAAVFFLTTLESRVKRRRALKAIHELRAMAHVIDMHQLTKDPERLLEGGSDSLVIDRAPMTQFELGRYLDYCSEALSLTGKVAALYIQGFDDPVALQAVNEVEELTTGLSRKVWQKLMVLYSAGPPSPPPPG